MLLHHLKTMEKTTLLHGSKHIISIVVPELCVVSKVQRNHPDKVAKGCDTSGCEESSWEG